MKKSTTILLIILGVLVLVFFNRQNQSTTNMDVPTQPTDDSISGVDSITTNNYANTTLDYYYYIPKKIAKSSTVTFLVMVPGLSGNGEGFVIIAPSFMEDAENWESKKSYQFPAVWSGQALNNILNSFMAKQNVHASTLYMLGFSAGAQFVSRYAMLYPDYVTACAFNAAGGTDDPLKYQSTKFYVAIGSQDLDVRQENARNFYDLAKQKRIDVTYKEYPIGHEFSQDELNDELAFFRQIKNGVR